MSNDITRVTLLPFVTLSLYSIINNKNYMKYTYTRTRTRTNHKHYRNGKFTGNRVTGGFYA